MATFDPHTLELLQFDRVRDLLAGYVARVVYLEEGAEPDYPPVIQSRFGFANVEDALAIGAAP